MQFCSRTICCCPHSCQLVVPIYTATLSNQEIHEPPSEVSIDCLKTRRTFLRLIRNSAIASNSTINSCLLSKLYQMFLGELGFESFDSTTLQGDRVAVPYCLRISRFIDVERDLARLEVAGKSKSRDACSDNTYSGCALVFRTRQCGVAHAQVWTSTRTMVAEEAAIRRSTATRDKVVYCSASLDRGSPLHPACIMISIGRLRLQ